MNKFLQGALALAFLFPASSAAQEQPPPLDGPGRIFQDALLENMSGAWTLSGSVRGRIASHSLDARWVLNHQFLQIHEKDTAEPQPGVQPYEASVFIGYDNASERYVAHWIDVFGGRFSETLGYGARSGNQIEFVFEYPDGPFHTIFRWLPEAKQWQWSMRMKNAKGDWTNFAEMTLARRATEASPSSDSLAPARTGFQLVNHTIASQPGSSALAGLEKTKTMNVKRITPLLFVAEIEPCAKFWTERLGFQITAQVPQGDKLGFVILQKGGVELMYQSYSSVEKDLPAINSVVRKGPSFLYIEVDDLDAVIQAVKGADYYMADRKTFYGSREIGVKDPAGHHVTFAQFAPQPQH